jgi:hypothetical protein
MTFEVSRKGFDGERRLNFDDLGKIYITVAIVWTTIVSCGSAFLLYNRDLPALRVRNTHLWTTAVGFLHAYWVLCLLAYVINGTYPCTAEFWIMSLWLPFGIALYQVNGMHLLHIASLQSRFITPEALHAYRGTRSGKSGWRSLRYLGLPDSLSRVQKICILLGVIVQVILGLDRALQNQEADDFQGHCLFGDILHLQKISSDMGSDWACCWSWKVQKGLGMVSPSNITLVDMF